MLAGGEVFPARSIVAASDWHYGRRCDYLTDRLLCASRPFLDMYIYSILSHKGIPPKDVDIDSLIDEIRRIGRADLVLQNIEARA